MAKRNNEPIKFKFLVGGRPWEELTEEEKEAWRKKAVARMGAAFENYFSAHPEEYEKLPG